MPFNNKIKLLKPGLNKFNLSHGRLLTNNMGELTPNLCELVMPGDVWKLSSTSKTYLQSMIGTTMGSFRVYQWYHFVPLRLLWKNFQEFITGGKDGNDATPQPVINSGADGWDAGSLLDHLGYVTNYFDKNNQLVRVPNFTATALGVRAYNQVINDWFINQNIEGMERTTSTDDGLDTTSDTSIFKTVWHSDYFVNNLPWAQRGNPVSLQLGEAAPVLGNGRPIGLVGFDGTNNTKYMAFGGYTTEMLPTLGVSESRDVNGTIVERIVQGNTTSLGLANTPERSNVYADISSVSGVTINQLRDAIAMQSFAEVSALTGARYIEYLLGFWGVRSSDKTLQRSQYLGGGVAPIYISEVAQTSSTDTTTPQGNLTSNGIAVNTAWGFKHRFEEFGILLGTFTIMPDAYYFQGSRRWMNYNSRWDYPNPLFAHLGEQVTEEKEIFAQGDGNSTVVDGVTVTDSTGFGFNPRYEEMRYIPSTIHGEFKTSLKFNHAARQFENPPLLNADFMQGTPSKRIFAVTTQDYDSCKTEIGFNIKCWRKLPKYGNPTTFGLMYGIGGY